MVYESHFDRGLRVNGLLGDRGFEFLDACVNLTSHSAYYTRTPYMSMCADLGVSPHSLCYLKRFIFGLVSTQYKNKPGLYEVPSPKINLVSIRTHERCELSWTGWCVTGALECRTT